MTVKQARLMADLSQEQMAKILCMHRNTYAALERDPGRFTLQQAWNFCVAVGRGLEEVFANKKQRRKA